LVLLFQKAQRDSPKAAMIIASRFWLGQKEPFLSKDQQDRLQDWWLVHKDGAKLPTWDLVVAASDSSHHPALVLVEAKAHGTELSESGKSWPRRKTPQQQARSDANHKRVGQAISETAVALRRIVPEISLSRDRCYQFANRIAFAWRLASMGIPVAMIYLGFIGDTAISRADDCFHDADQWTKAFHDHTVKTLSGNNVWSRSRLRRCFILAAVTQSSGIAAIAFARTA
jgi:hypothetical protein